VAVIHNATPEVANVLLGRTVLVNRDLRPDHIVNFVCTIEDKDFYPLINTIKINSEGEVIDGQHRLLAILAAGIPVPALLLVVLGRDEAMSFIDSDQAVRNEQDSLRIVGKKPVHGTIIGGLALERKPLIQASYLSLALERKPLIRSSSRISAASAPTSGFSICRGLGIFFSVAPLANTGNAPLLTLLCYSNCETNQLSWNGLATKTATG
jgi:hypothetical protein